MKSRPDTSNAALLTEAASALSQATRDTVEINASQHAESHQKVITPLPTPPSRLPDLSLEPERLVGPEEYIADSRKKGIDDITIIEQMEEHGWRSEMIVDALEKTRQPGGTLPRTRQTRRTPTARFVAGMAAILMVVGVGSYLFPRQEQPAATAQLIAVSSTVIDKNYQLTLPSDWVAAGQNADGARVNKFYQTGVADGTGGHLTVTVTPAGDGRVSDQSSRKINDLNQNGNVTAVISNETVVQSDYTANLLIIKSTAANDPSHSSYFIYSSGLYGQNLYHIDGMIPAKQWTKHKAAVINSVKSLTPLNR